MPSFLTQAMMRFWGHDVPENQTYWWTLLIVGLSLLVMLYVIWFVG
jgi:hypothetical protein